MNRVPVIPRTLKEEKGDLAAVFRAGLQKGGSLLGGPSASGGKDAGKKRDKSASLEAAGLELPPPPQDWDLHVLYEAHAASLLCVIQTVYTWILLLLSVSS